MFALLLAYSLTFADCPGGVCPIRNVAATVIHAAGNVLPPYGFARLPANGPNSVARPQPVRNLVRFTLSVPRRLACRLRGF